MIVLWGHSPAATPKLRLFFQQLTDKKAPGNHSTKEEDSSNNDGTMNEY